MRGRAENTWAPGWGLLGLAERGTLAFQLGWITLAEQKLSGSHADGGQQALHALEAIQRPQAHVPNLSPALLPAARCSSRHSSLVPVATSSRIPNPQLMAKGTKGHTGAAFQAIWTPRERAKERSEHLCLMSLPKKAAGAQSTRQV